MEIAMSNPAEGYESYMVPTLFSPWATRLVDAAEPKPSERVLDVGCGTGIVARTVAARIRASSGEVTGIDPSPNMLTVARTVSARAGAAVDWREGSAEHLPFADRSFDLVLSQFALMFFADKAAGLAEMRRVVRGDGRVLLSVWQGLEQHPFYRTLDRVIQQRVGVSALQDIFALGNSEELRRLARAAGFTHVDIEPISMTARFPNPDGFLAGEIEVDTAAIPSMQHLDDQARRAIVAAIAQDVKSPLEAITQDDHVVIEFHANMIRARP
jgi:ubiquinone/menaquinone biosynthesis C-methylase UbiE